MSPTLAGALLAATCLAVLIRLATRREVQPPPGVEIIRFKETGWTYIFEDRVGGSGTGYLTRRGAILGAQDEAARRARLPQTMSEEFWERRDDA